MKCKSSFGYVYFQEFANQNDLTYLETSAKTSTNVEQAFMTMTAEMKNKFDTGIHQNPRPVKLDDIHPGKNVQSSGWCNC